MLDHASNIGLLPSVMLMGPAASAIATQASEGFSKALQYIVLPQLQAFPGIDIRVFELFRAVTQRHDDFGSSTYGLTLTDVESPCVTPDVAPFVSPTPDTNLFWDGIHPTKAVHATLAAEVAAFLAQ